MSDLREMRSVELLDMYRKGGHNQEKRTDIMEALLHRSEIDESVIDLWVAESWIVQLRTAYSFIDKCPRDRLERIANGEEKTSSIIMEILHRLAAHKGIIIKKAVE